jgi:hypothetical protein
MCNKIILIFYDELTIIYCKYIIKYSSILECNSYNYKNWINSFNYNGNILMFKLKIWIIKLNYKLCVYYN